jgi:hypothetical protein
MLGRRRWRVLPSKSGAALRAARQRAAQTDDRQRLRHSFTIPASVAQASRAHDARGLVAENLITMRCPRGGDDDITCLAARVWSSTVHRIRPERMTMT